MKTFVLASTMALALVSGEAMAVCSGNSRLNATQLGTVLTNNTVCVANGTGWEWQELHAGNGNLVDYKRGPGHAIDPSETVGSWSVNGTGNGATVRHNYGSGGSYDYSVFDNGNGTHSFCSSRPEIVGRVKSGGGPC